MNKTRILILENDDLTVEAVNLALQNIPEFETEVYHSFAEAQQALAYRVHEIIIVDIHLKGVSSRDLIRHMRHAHPLCAVIAFSNQPKLTEIHECIEFGYADYFIHPLEGDQPLLKSIQFHAEKIHRWKNRFCL